MAGFRSTRGRAASAAAALIVGVGALAGCRAGSTDSSPVHISRLPEQVPSASGTPAPSAGMSTQTPAARPTGRPAPPLRQPGSTAGTVLKTGAEGGKVRELQARLRQLELFDRNPTGYYGPVTAASVKNFQEQRGGERTGEVTEGLRTSLEARTHEPSRSELYPPTTRPLDEPDPRCRTGRALCISKESRTLAWMVGGRVRAAMDVRFGSAYTPTREGEFKVDFKSRRHHSTLYDTPMPYAMFFSGGQAVHYSADFAAAGYTGASHGCVNVRDRKKIASVFAQVRKGDKVVVHR